MPKKSSAVNFKSPKVYIKTLLLSLLAGFIPYFIGLLFIPPIMSLSFFTVLVPGLSNLKNWEMIASVLVALTVIFGVAIIPLIGIIAYKKIVTPILKSPHKPVSVFLLRLIYIVGFILPNSFFYYIMYRHFGV
jgi:fucose permease